MQQPRFFRTSFHKKKPISVNTYRYISQVKKPKDLLPISLILHGNWQKQRVFCLPKSKAPVHHIQQSYTNEASSKECWSWISKSCSHCLFTFASIGFFCVFFATWQSDGKTLIHWKMKCGKNGHSLFKLYETEVGSRSTHLRRIYDKWLLERLEFWKLVPAFWIT